jgi:phosphoribosyl-dephospho-CoA transferase
MERLVIPDGPAPTHSLIRLRQPSALFSDAPEPPWVEAALKRTPWVVVRRGWVRDGLIPVGVRGTARKQRYAASVAVAAATDWLVPEDLTEARSRISPQRLETVRALAALARIVPILARRGLRGGPCGSVGFEIATGAETVTPASDLDLVLWQDRRLEPDEATGLYAALVEAADPIRVDVLLETPQGGVSLAELAARAPRVLVRGPDGPWLCDDPWRARMK